MRQSKSVRTFLLPPACIVEPDNIGTAIDGSLAGPIRDQFGTGKTIAAIAKLRSDPLRSFENAGIGSFPRSFTAITRVQIPSGTPNKINSLVCVHSASVLGRDSDVFSVGQPFPLVLSGGLTAA